MYHIMSAPCDLLQILNLTQWCPQRIFPLYGHITWVTWCGFSQKMHCWCAEPRPKFSHNVRETKVKKCLPIYGGTCLILVTTIQIEYQWIVNICYRLGTDKHRVFVYVVTTWCRHIFYHSEKLSSPFFVCIWFVNFQLVLRKPSQGPSGDVHYTLPGAPFIADQRVCFLMHVITIPFYSIKINWKQERR